MGGKLGNSPEAIVSGSIAHYSNTVVANRKRLGGTPAPPVPESAGEPE
jgi:hypothetical protein